MKPLLPPPAIRPVLDAFYDNVCHHLSNSPVAFCNGLAEFELADASHPLLQAGMMLPHPLRDLAPDSRYMRAWRKVIQQDEPVTGGGPYACGPAEARWRRLVERIMPHRHVPEVYRVEHPRLSRLCEESGLQHGPLELFRSRPRLSVYWRVVPGSRPTSAATGLYGVSQAPPSLAPVPGPVLVYVQRPARQAAA